MFAISSICLKGATSTNISANVQNTPTLAMQIFNTYTNIHTLSCEIRKTTESDDKTIRWLSRIHFERPNQIHVDNASPFKRTIIADGKNLFYYQDGALRGFSRPIDKLSDMWLASLHNVPGTATEHLAKIRNTAETVLPNTADNSIRRGYNVKNMFVVLTASPDRKKLLKITFYKDKSMQDKTAEYIYTKQIEVLPCCWIPTHHKATLYLPAEKVIKESRRISNLVVNKPIPEQIFNHELFMKGIEFSSDFKSTYQ